MIHSEEERLGFRIDYVRFMLGQTSQSFPRMLGIDYDYYVNEVVKSPVLYKINLDVLYKLYYFMSEVGSNIYAEWYANLAKELVPFIQKRIEQRIEYNRKLSKSLLKKEPEDFEFNNNSNSKFTQLHVLLNQSAKMFCILNGFSVDEYNSIVNSNNLEEIDPIISFKIYYVLREILNNKYNNGEVISLCEEYIKICNVSIEDYMNRSIQEKPKVNKRLKEE